MIKSKSYWLATAAVLTSVVAAQAADLPFRKAAPVEYVRVCDAFGQGFFYIPGTDTCLRVLGQIRAEYTIRGGAPTNNQGAVAINQAGTVYRRDLSNFRARGYLNADARTQTAYGTLRTFVSIRVTDDTTPSGPFGGRGETIGGRGVSTGAFQGFNNSQQTILDKGFIQFAGITAGRAQSFFDFDAQSYELLTNSLANSNQLTEMFAYTATFGSGFSATLSVEDRNERTIADNGTLVYSGLTAGSSPVLPGNVTGTVNNPRLASLTNPQGTASVLAYAGETIPDIVGNVRYDGTWGSAQLSGAYHQVKSIPVSILTSAGVSTGRTVAPEADGFAVLGGVKILLPMLAKGDSVTFQGTYDQGAMDYIDPLNYYNGATNVYSNTTAGVPTQFGIPVNDAYVLPNGKISMSKAAGGYAAFRHYFVPTVYGSLFGDYVNITNSAAAQRIGASNGNADVYQVGANVVWTPVKDLQIGGEVLYTNLHYYGLGATAANTVGNTTPATNDDLRGRFSIRRAF